LQFTHRKSPARGRVLMAASKHIQIDSNPRWLSDQPVKPPFKIGPFWQKTCCASLSSVYCL